MATKVKTKKIKNEVTTYYCGECDKRYFTWEDAYYCCGYLSKINRVHCEIDNIELAISILTIAKINKRNIIIETPIKPGYIRSTSSEWGGYELWENHVLIDNTILIPLTAIIGIYIYGQRTLN
jgi:hypothetical protein